MTDSVQKQDGQQERRRANRAALSLVAGIRIGSRSKVEARLIDISTHGCRVEFTAAADPDTWLWLNIAGLEAQYCRIVWRAREFAGLEFEKPLAEPVLERLLNMHQDMTEKTIKDLRDIAARSHWLAAKGSEQDIHALAELSRECAVDAVVESLRLTEARRAGKSS